MSGCIKVIRVLFSIFFVLLLLILTMWGIPMAGLTQTITQRQNIKTLVKETGFYDNSTEIILDLMASSQHEDSVEGDAETQPEDRNDLQDPTETPANNQNNAETQNTTTQEAETAEEDLPSFTQQINDENSETRKIAEEIFTPEFVEQSTNTIIDAFYDWFEGKTPKPQFEIQMVKDEQSLERLVTVATEERIKNMPECDTTVVDNPDFDPIKEECVPPGFDDGDIDKYIEQEITDEQLKEIQKESTLSSDEFEIDPELSADVQQAFKSLKYIPIAVMASILIISIILVLVVPGFKGGLIVTGLVQIITALLTIFLNIYTTMTEFAFEQQMQPDETTQYVYENLVLPANKIISGNSRTYSLIVLGLGLILLVLGIFVVKKKNARRRKRKRFAKEPDTPSPKKETPQRDSKRTWRGGSATFGSSSSSSKNTTASQSTGKTDLNKTVSSIPSASNGSIAANQPSNQQSTSIPSGTATPNPASSTNTANTKNTLNNTGPATNLQGMPAAQTQNQNQQTNSQNQGTQTAYTANLPKPTHSQQQTPTTQQQPSAPQQSTNSLNQQQESSQSTQQQNNQQQPIQQPAQQQNSTQSQIQPQQQTQTNTAQPANPPQPTSQTQPQAQQQINSPNPPQQINPNQPSQPQNLPNQPSQPQNLPNNPNANTTNNNNPTRNTGNTANNLPTTQ